MSSLSFRVLSLRLEQFVRDLQKFPWATTAQTLRERFREDRLGLTASSLTFTTTLALVPFITVALAVFTAFPMFSQMQGVLQRWLIDSLVPDSISRQVLGYLTQFASKASKLGVAGLAIVLTTALALILTIDRTLNAIWRVKRQRRLAQRVLMYWAALTLGPLLLGASLAITSFAISASRGVVGGLPGGVRFLFDLLEFGLLAGGAAAMYFYVPNTQVRWGHAWAGGLFVALGIELAKKLLGIYLGMVPTYSAVYGAFATFPILLVWIYVAWVIVLLGAVVAAYLPSLLMGVARRVSGHGWQFQLALEMLQQLHRARAQPFKGLRLEQLAQSLQLDPLLLEPVLDALVSLDWVGELADTETGAAPRFVLLADPDTTPLAPLVQRLLLEHSMAAEGLWGEVPLGALQLRNVL
jgi:membrane protein